MFCHLHASQCRYVSISNRNGNLLSPADYGTINTLLSLSIVVGVPSGIISTLVATYTAKYQAVGKPELIGGFMHKMLRASVLLACVVFAAGAALSSIIANVLQIEETQLHTGHHGRGGVQLCGAGFQLYAARC